MKKDVKIIPYMTVDGIWTYKDSEMRSLYNKVYTDGMADRVFFDGSIKDADHFVQLMKSPTNYLHVIYYKEKLVGMAWINRIETTNANCHWFFYREYWGLPAVYTVGIAWLKYLVDTYDFDLIYGLTPSSNKLALRYLRNLGLDDLGEVPGMLWSDIDQTAIPAHFMFITRSKVNAL